MQVQGINGVMQLVAALPAGYLTDRVRRDTMLKAAAIVGALAGASRASLAAVPCTILCMIYCRSSRLPDSCVQVVMLTCFECVCACRAGSAAGDRVGSAAGCTRTCGWGSGRIQGGHILAI